MGYHAGISCVLPSGATQATHPSSTSSPSQIGIQAENTPANDYGAPPPYTDANRGYGGGGGYGGGSYTGYGGGAYTGNNLYDYGNNANSNPAYSNYNDGNVGEVCGAGGGLSAAGCVCCEVEIYPNDDGAQCTIAGGAAGAGDGAFAADEEEDGNVEMHSYQGVKVLVMHCNLNLNLNQQQQHQRESDAKANEEEEEGEEEDVAVKALTLRGGGSAAAVFGTEAIATQALYDVAPELEILDLSYNQLTEMYVNTDSLFSFIFRVVVVSRLLCWLLFFFIYFF